MHPQPHCGYCKVYSLYTNLASALQQLCISYGFLGYKGCSYNTPFLTVYGQMAVTPSDREAIMASTAIKAAQDV